MSLMAASGACRAPEPPSTTTERAAPVEVASVLRGPIVAKRSFSGTLESPARFDVAARVAGRLESVEVDLGDVVERGQVVARLEQRELRQRFAEAEANTAVADAALGQAERQAEIAARDLARAERLEAKGVSSPAQLDAARAALATADGVLAVARAERRQARAGLDLARLLLSETEIRADWRAGGDRDDRRRVARRWATAGALVEANAPLFTVVALDPLNCVISVEERDYGRLKPGLKADLYGDAFPGEAFSAELVRVAPVFEAGSRQARVELQVDNREAKLKPGMFVRVELELTRIEDAQIVPVSAVTKRDDAEGLFRVVDGVARWTEVELGVREADRVQVLSPQLDGRVITLGQQLVDEGTLVTIPEERFVEDAAADVE